MRARILSGLTIAGALLLARAQAADSYKIDPAHTRVGFSIRHMGISNVRGGFDDFVGAIALDNAGIK